MKRAGAPLDKQLTGRALASYVLAEALDGKPLPEGRGPFRRVVPQDKKGARSSRMLERLTVVKLRK